LIVISGFLALSGFFRLLGTMCKSYDQAARLAAVIITIMCACIVGPWRSFKLLTWALSRLRITYSGYLVSFPVAQYDGA
jgi:hypothetical protein